jgi:hypothetical protein
MRTDEEIITIIFDLHNFLHGLELRKLRKLGRHNPQNKRRYLLQFQHPKKNILVNNVSKRQNIHHVSSEQHVILPLCHPVVLFVDISILDTIIMLIQNIFTNNVHGCILTIVITKDKHFLQSCIIIARYLLQIVTFSKYLIK